MNIYLVYLLKFNLRIFFEERKIMKTISHKYFSVFKNNFNVNRNNKFKLPLSCDISQSLKTIQDIPFFKFQRRRLFKKFDIPKNHYQTLGVSVDSDYEQIKKAYYKLAKKHHPDINPDSDSIEKFKEIKKAYEILGDPNLRISYDIENKFSNENSSIRNHSNERYTNRYGKRVMKGPRSIKNFYWDKWSEFKTPKWSNFYTGMDFKSEYIFRNQDDDLDISHRMNSMKRSLIKYRFIFYALFLFSVDIYFCLDNLGLYLNYRLIMKTFFDKETDNLQAQK